MEASASPGPAVRAALAHNLDAVTSAVHPGLTRTNHRPRADEHSGMPTIVDLSHPILDGMITYPGLPAPKVSDHLTREASRERYASGYEFHIGAISMVGNTGTYLDVPFHRFADGHDLAELDLGRVAGVPGVVVDVAGTDATTIAVRALLVRTGWSRHFGSDACGDPSHPYLAADLAEALAAGGVAVIGIDSVISTALGPANAPSTPAPSPPACPSSSTSPTSTPSARQTRRSPSRPCHPRCSASAASRSGPTPSSADHPASWKITPRATGRRADHADSRGATRRAACRGPGNASVRSTRRRTRRPPDVSDRVTSSPPGGRPDHLATFTASTEVNQDVSSEASWSKKTRATSSPRVPTPTLSKMDFRWSCTV